MGSSKGLRSVYLAWVGEGVRIPGRGPPTSVFRKGVRTHGLSRLPGVAVCASRHCARRGRDGTVRPNSVISKADGNGRKGLIKGWASVIIPTSLAGVEIAGSVKFTTAVPFSWWRCL